MVKIFSDAEVIRRYRAGDKDAFHEIVKRYKNFAYTYFFRSSRSHEDAEELAQEAFIRVFKDLEKGKLDEYQSIAKLFKTIVENLAIDHERRTKGDEAPEVVDVAQEPEPEAPASYASDAELDFKELRYETARAIKKLPLALRVPAKLNILYEHTPQEIAERLGLDVRVVWDRLGRARKALRITLAHHKKGHNHGNRRLGQAASGAARPTDGGTP